MSSYTSEDINNTIRLINQDKRLLDMIIEVSDKSTVDSLKDEIMDIGWKLDSMTLKYDEGWEFTN